MPHPDVLAEHSDSKPPLLASWRAWYALVLAALAVEVALMAALTHYFAA
ncbi:hypothetical protein [Hymenobacter coalescens]